MTSLLSGATGWRRCEASDDDVDLARDRLLVSRAQAGDLHAFDDLYLRYYRRLHRFCLRRLHDAHEAEDVAQEAFARAWRALPSFGGERRFYPWLSVIASHLCTDVVRRRTRSTPVAEFHQGNVASVEDGGEEIVVAAADGDLAARAFARLSDRHRRVLDLREGSGWSYQRIADHEGVGITAVETLLWRARQALKREFAALGGTEGSGAALAGGVFTLTRLRRLLGAPAAAARRLAHAGPGAVLAIGSAAATTAVIVVASVHGSPSSPPLTQSLPRAAIAAPVDHPGQPNAGSTAGAARAVDPWGRALLIGPPAGTESVATGGPGASGAGTPTDAGTAPGGSSGPGLLGSSGSGVLGDPGSKLLGNSDLGSTVGQVGTAASGLVGGVSSALQKTVGGVGQALNNAASAAGQVIDNTTAPLLGNGSQASGGTGVGGTASTTVSTVVSSATDQAASVTNQVVGGVSQLTNSLLGKAPQLLGGK
jgi:RNA polymerase sigma-70 factor, ECF subfamily